MAVDPVEAAKEKKAGDLFEEFRRSAEAISARVYRAGNYSEAAGIIVGLIREHSAKKVVATSTPLVESLYLDDITREAPVCRDNLRLHAAGADIGVSEADFAIAETGTLVCEATDINARLVSTLPPVHVALVYEDRLVASLEEAIGLYAGGDRGHLPGYLSFISGPSRTADIERILTIGVHGPSELHIIFVGKPGGGDR
ncbi:MAG: hypothetical protein JL50_06910 [Peptococcaceae bacterium BICA1-7]|nr:MAG: hypothetical protein JL50_06910 [Peptococcaceae bacterium BICA1-7]HBV99204.1 lactate utilization protein B/C [Desulfotomaculum sp.]